MPYYDYDYDNRHHGSCEDDFYDRNEHCDKCKNKKSHCCNCIGPQGPQGSRGPQGVPGVQGPQGEHGEQGTGLELLGAYPTLADLIAAHPTGNTGDAYAVNGTIYVWDTDTNSWQPAGSVGASGLVLLGAYPTLAALQAAHPIGNPGDAYAVNGTIYVWDTDTRSWQPAGSVGAQGPQGEQGEQGEQGTGLQLLGAYPTLADLIAAHPTGNTGDAYAVNGTIYVWDTDTNSWQPAGSVGASGLVLLGAYPTLAALQAAHPIGNPGDAYAVNGTIYVWDTDTSSWQPAGPVGAQGPQGEQGEQGTGLELLGAYPTLADLIAAHPTGNTGDAYAVNGTIYVWDTDTGSWQPAGSVGASGLVLLGSYPTLADLEAAHPIGNPGDAYAVNGTIYVWDTDTSSWQAAGPVGAQGPQGEQGEQGEQGTGLELLGAYPTLADLMAAHPTGNTGDAYAVNGTIYVWDTDTNSWQPAGSVGASGLVLLGAYPTLAALQAAHPIGNPGDAYAVNGTIYVWDTDTSSWQPAGPVGAQGPPGPEASSYTIIPFSSQQAPYVGTNNGGAPSNVALLGFGYLEYSTGGTANVAIDIDQNDGVFNLTSTSNRQAVFSLPYDVTLNSIYITVGNWGDFGLIVPTGTLIYPYVHIYAAEPGTNNFFPIADAFAIPTVGIDPTVAVAATMRAGSKTGLNIDLSAGTRIAICGMMQITGDTAGRNYYMYFTGGIGMRIRSTD